MKPQKSKFGDFRGKWAVWAKFLVVSDLRIQHSYRCYVATVCLGALYRKHKEA